MKPCKNLYSKQEEKSGGISARFPGQCAGGFPREDFRETEALQKALQTGFM